MRAIHQCVPELTHGDAVTQQVLAVQAVLRELNIPSRVFAAGGDARMAGGWQPYESYAGDADNVVLYHYCVGSPLTEWARSLPDRVVIYYHNITPAEFMDDYSPSAARVMRQGREDLAALAPQPYAIACSNYSRRELLSLGYAEVDVLPCFLDVNQLRASAESNAGKAVVQRYSDGWATWLTVSRIAPNKRQDDVIRLFAYYRRWINRRARLFLVGSPDYQAGYQQYLRWLVQRLGLTEVHFTGRVPLEEGFGGYYAAASLFVSMSEHEGFGMPLLEAMAFDVPVMAFQAGAVPDTMGDAGVLFAEKQYEVLAELADLLVRPGLLRQKVIARQREHVARFMPEETTRLAKRIIRRLLEEI